MLGTKFQFLKLLFHQFPNYLLLANTNTRESVQEHC